MLPPADSAIVARLTEDSGKTGSRTGQALALLGDHWTLMILVEVFRGQHRYLEIRDSIRISDSILASRLKTLVAGGLLTKQPYKDGRIRHEYHLTRSGRATWRIFLAAWAWQHEWLTTEEGPGNAVVHLQCGGPARSFLNCGKCKTQVLPRDTSVELSMSKLSFVGEVPRRHRQARTLAIHDDSLLHLHSETMELLGDRWNTALAAAAAIGHRRFVEFERFLGIPPTVLSSRLVRFEELGVLRPTGLAGGSSRSEHRLTAKGRAFIAILVQIVRWSDDHLETNQPSIKIIHRACGRKLLAELACGSCGEPLRLSQLNFPLVAPRNRK